MDQYLSTYRKDFIWPYVRTFPIRSSKSYPERGLQAKPPYRRVPCICGAEPGGLMPTKEYVGPLDAEAHQWSRLGPMAPLLDPKLYPAKMGPAPEFEITRYDQPNTYLKKLHEKYPYLYNILQSAPPDEMIRCVDKDRLKTTYQVDYSHMNEHPSADYDKLLANAGISDWTNKIPCARKIPAVLDCRANIRPPDYSNQYETQNCEKYSRKEFNDYRESKNRSNVFENETGEYGDFREAMNDRNGFERYAERYEDFRETKSNRDTYRIDDGRFGDTREANHRNGFRKDVRGFGDSREAMNDRSFKNESGRVAREYGDSREIANRGDGFRDESGRNPRMHGDSREATNKRDDYANESGRNPRETVALKNIDDGNKDVGRKTDIGGFASPDGDERKSKRTGKIDEQDSAKNPLSTWRSEYQEIIGQTGYDIIRDKMHKHGDRSKGRSFIERIIMKCHV